MINSNLYYKDPMARRLVSEFSGSRAQSVVLASRYSKLLCKQVYGDSLKNIMFYGMLNNINGLKFSGALMTPLEYNRYVISKDELLKISCSILDTMAVRVLSAADSVEEIKVKLLLEKLNKCTVPKAYKISSEELLHNNMGYNINLYKLNNPKLIARLKSTHSCPDKSYDKVIDCIAIAYPDKNAVLLTTKEWAEKTVIELPIELNGIPLSYYLADLQHTHEQQHGIVC